MTIFEQKKWLKYWFWLEN